MGRPRFVPDKAELEQLLAAGYTHEMIVDHIRRTTGEEVTRSTVSAAISRAGLSTPQNRYTDTIPWRVRVDHLRDYPVRMLRLLGRRRAGEPLNEVENLRLDNWLKTMKSDKTVVVYDPDKGFAYATRVAEDPKDLPIHVKPVKLS